MHLSRRRFLAGAGAAALGATLISPQWAGGAEANEKINFGIIGCGGRGAWIADLFAKSGRFNVVAAADYFQDRVDAVGAKHNIPADRRYSGLSGYKRLLEGKLDAVAIETPPFFHPEQIAAAVEAGKHIYCAKPLAVDVPGCQSIAESGRKATEKKLALLVDFQTRAMPAYQEVLGRVHKGGIGKLVTVYAEDQTSLMFQERDNQVRQSPNDPEVRLRAWGIDRVLSGDVITEQNIHALDVATWFVNANPIKAIGHGGRARPFLGDCWDHYSVLFHFPEDLVVTFTAKQVGFGFDDIMVRAHGMTGTAETNYGGKCWLRSRDDGYNGATDNIYLVGVERNIVTFHDMITKGEVANLTVAPSVRSNLTTILGRTAAYRKAEVTWAEMMKTAEKWEFNTKGMKA
jgi:myo-inositol 2-dehydrogenase / D-chiro-inositol 1-dehydrogenase